MKDEELESQGMSPECPTCDTPMAFVKRKKSTKEWPNENGYSDWTCKNQNCSKFDEDHPLIHRLFDSGDCEER